jgi:insulysin
MIWFLVYFFLHFLSDSPRFPSWFLDFSSSSPSGTIAISEKYLETTIDSQSTQVPSERNSFKIHFFIRPSALRTWCHRILIAQWHSPISGYSPRSRRLGVAFTPSASIMASYDLLAETQSILRPDLDQRQYRYLKLKSNALPILLISDAQTDKSAAALDVNVGHLQDPHDLPGLAHFLEHLLFMGTQKYPKENEYSEYLTEHGGFSNAFTAAAHTNYYFEVAATGLEGALDRFSQFFIAPLFSESCTERELLAVDSEHKKNIQIDAWRLMQLRKSLCDPSEGKAPGHPFSQFGTGHYESLGTRPRASGVDTRAKLIDFHHQYYSANIMRLVVLGREDLDTLTQWAVERFQGIKNHDLRVPEESITTHPWTDPRGQSMAGKLVRVKTVKDVKSVELRWAFPSTRPWWKSQPNRYISHLIGHEGNGSLLSYLKSQGWATELYAGEDDAGSHYDFFSVTVVLTDKGMAQVEDVVESIFSFLELLKDAKCPQWIHDEVKMLADIKFRFKETGSVSSLASRLSGTLHRPFPPELVLKGSSAILEWAPDNVFTCLNALNQEVQVTLCATQFPNLTAPFKKERWYATEYAVEDLPSAMKLKINSPKRIPEIMLPKPNPFLPKSLDVTKHKETQPIPKMVFVSEYLRCWHQLDDEFWVPRAALMLKIKRYTNPDLTVSFYLLLLRVVRY